MKTIGKRAPTDRPSRLLERLSSRLSPVYGSNYWVPTAHSLEVPGSPLPELPHERPTANGRAPEDLGVAVLDGASAPQSRRHTLLPLMPSRPSMCL